MSGESEVELFIPGATGAPLAGPGAGNLFGNYHWVHSTLRRRSADGKYCFDVETPVGRATSGWLSASSAITGTNPAIYIGANANPTGSGPSYFEGYIDNLTIWNRCVTDHEEYLLWNPGTDGNSGFTPSSGSGWYWGGRQWPFNY